jgi:hypothetical protein
VDTSNDHADEFDPLEHPAAQAARGSTSRDLTDKVHLLQARQDAFRSIADRFYMLWWNMPEMSHHNIDREIVDLFRKYMELAPSLGVSRNGIPELRECCGRKRSRLPGDLNVDLTKSISGADKVVSPYHEESLGWCPGDVIRRITKFFGVGFCEKCDRRRRWINRFFWCGNGK